jgi:RNA recognition motif-containing protein
VDGMLLCWHVIVHQHFSATGVVLPILIRNLPRSVVEAEVKAMFSPFGVVLSCDLVMDNDSGQSKGFAFVEMEKQEHADKAIQTLNMTVVKENKIRVKWSRQEKHQSSSKNSQSQSQEYQNVWDAVKPPESKE